MDNPIHPPGAPIRIRLFAGLREQAGWAERHWPVIDYGLKNGHPTTGPLTPRQLWMELRLQADITTVRVAINQEFATVDTPLNSGDELAFLPPISGG